MYIYIPAIGLPDWFPSFERVSQDVDADVYILHILSGLKLKPTFNLQSMEKLHAL